MTGKLPVPLYSLIDRRVMRDPQIAEARLSAAISLRHIKAAHGRRIAIIYMSRVVDAFDIVRTKAAVAIFTHGSWAEEGLRFD